MRNSLFVKLGLSAGMLVALSGAVVATTAQAASAAPTCVDAAKTIRNHFATFDVAAHHNAPDGLISYNDMVAVAGGNYPDHIRSAARLFVRNARLFDELDTAAHGGSTDDRVSHNDLVAFIARGRCG